MKTRILAACFECGILLLITAACLRQRLPSRPPRPTVITLP